MKIYILFFVTFFHLSNQNLLATTYYPMPISGQISSAYGVIQGVYQGMSYKKESGKVVTVFTFGVDKYIGLKKNEILNRNSFLVSTPGGVWNGLTYSIPGTPRFRKGERVVLLINKGKRGFTLQNLSLGKYSIFKQDGAYYLKSSVFPSHSKLGKIRYDQFKEMAQKKFKANFISFKGTPKYYAEDDKKYLVFEDKIKKQNSKRRPASLDLTNEDEKSTELFWPLILLLIVSIYSVFILRKN